MSFFGIDNTSRAPFFRQLGALNDAGKVDAKWHSPSSKLDDPGQGERTSQKWKAVQNPIPNEANEHKLRAPPAYHSKQRERAYRRMKERAMRIPDEPLRTAELAAVLAAERMNLDKEIDARITNETVNNFRDWMMGRGNPNDHVRSGWWEKKADGTPGPMPQWLKRGGPISTHPSVERYLNKFVTARVDYEKDLALMDLHARWGPRDWDINKLWAFYKYRVLGMMPAEIVDAEIDFALGDEPDPVAAVPSEAQMAESDAERAAKGDIREVAYGILNHAITMQDRQQQTDELIYQLNNTLSQLAETMAAAAAQPPEGGAARPNPLSLRDERTRAEVARLRADMARMQDAVQQATQEAASTADAHARELQRRDRDFEELRRRHELDLAALHSHAEDQHNRLRQTLDERVMNGEMSARQAREIELLRDQAHEQLRQLQERHALATEQLRESHRIAEEHRHASVQAHAENHMLREETARATEELRRHVEQLEHNDRQIAEMMSHHSRFADHAAVQAAHNAELHNQLAALHDAVQAADAVQVEQDTVQAMEHDAVQPVDALPPAGTVQPVPAPVHDAVQPVSPPAPPAPAPPLAAPVQNTVQPVNAAPALPPPSPDVPRFAAARDLDAPLEPQVEPPAPAPIEDSVEDEFGTVQPVEEEPPGTVQAVEPEPEPVRAPLGLSFGARAARAAAGASESPAMAELMRRIREPVSSPAQNTVQPVPTEGTVQPASGVSAPFAPTESGKRARVIRDAQSAVEAETRQLAAAGEAAADASDSLGADGEFVDFARSAMGRIRAALRVMQEDAARSAARDAVRARRQAQADALASRKLRSSVSAKPRAPTQQQPPVASGTVQPVGGDWDALRGQLDPAHADTVFPSGPVDADFDARDRQALVDRLARGGAPNPRYLPQRAHDQGGTVAPSAEVDAEQDARELEDLRHRIGDNRPNPRITRSRPHPGGGTVAPASDVNSAHAAMMAAQAADERMREVERRVRRRNARKQ